jgi:hypothetical protein
MVAPGHVRASPFVRVRGGAATEAVTGQRYALTPAEERLVAACAEERPVAALDPTERELAARLISRLVLVDDHAWRSIAALALGSIDLEVAGSCNAECVFCPRDDLRAGRGLGIMHEDTFQRVVEIFGPTVKLVGFVGIGEPTLHKSLPRYVQTFRALGAQTMLVTNGSLLTDTLIEALIAAGLDGVKVSFNGHDDRTRASYEEHMVGLDYDATRARVEALLARARGRMPVAVSAVETAHNHAALAGFAEFWRARGAVKATIIPCHSRGGTIVPLRPRAAAHGSDGVLARCGLYNTRCFVSWDGRVLACCHDVNGATQLGDVAVDDAATLAARKLEVMRAGAWYPVCATCDEPARDLTTTPKELWSRRA